MWNSLIHNIFVLKNIPRLTFYTFFLSDVTLQTDSVAVSDFVWISRQLNLLPHVILVKFEVKNKMPVIKHGSCSPEPHRGHKRPRSQLSNGPGGARTLVPSPPGGAQARPGLGAWPGMGGAGPTVNIPDSRYSYGSPPSNLYTQVTRFLFYCFVHNLCFL